MKENEKKRLWIGVIIGVVVGIITLIALLCGLIYLFLFGEPAEIATDISKYEKTITQYENMNTALIVFPEKIPESAHDTDFYFYYRDTWNLPTMEVFLQCTYDREDYLVEIQRLENTQKRYGSNVRTLIKDESDRFFYPAYIAIDGYGSSYEYALLTGENQITYVYSACKYSEYLEKIEAKYLPSDFDSHMDELDGPEGYCIYLESVDVVNGEVFAWGCDYTRDEVVEVLKCHSLSVDYNSFQVYTYLDEKDREIIKYCAYVYYEDEQDAMYGLPDEIPYAELEGYRFESVKWNKDKTKAIVTYYDGKMKKTFEYEVPRK